MSDCAAQVDAWLEPLGDPLCGQDLEYDPEYLDLNKAAEGKPETQFSPAEPPDWGVVAELSASLINRSRDVRLAMLWGRAMLHREGLSALPHTLRLVREWFERYWDDVHPKPDPDDGDLFSRMNALATLESLSAMLGDVRQCVVFRNRAIGQLTVRDIEVALERLPAREGESAMSLSSIEQMLTDAIAVDEALRTLPARAREELNQLLAVIIDKAGYGQGPECETLKEVLHAVGRVIPAEGGASSDSDQDSEDTGEQVVVRAARSGGGGIGGAIDTRQDAIKAIDLVCQYLERTEPTNPAQWLLRRAQKLIDKNFLELVKELAPEALGEVAKIMGVDPDSIEGGGYDR